MITTLQPILVFLGLMTNLDASQIPLGGGLEFKNVAQFDLGRLRRIPGVTASAAAVEDGQLQIPLVFIAKGIGAGGVDQLIAVMEGASAVKVVNLSTGLAMTGPALAAPLFGKPWTSTFYANKYIFAGGGNTSIYQINNATAYAAVTGSPSPPAGNLVISFLDKLYVSDIASAEGEVRVSDTLTTDFQASSIVNVKEIPGKVTALAVNSPSTDQQGIYTQLVIVKKNAIWVYDGTSKDVVSQIVGSDMPASFANTQAGLVFLGRKGQKYTAFLLPIGTTGEPKDVGLGITDLIAGSSAFSPLGAAHAVTHGRFYKLFYSVGTENNNPHEVWLDTETLSMAGDIIWAGPHGRGQWDTSVVDDSTLRLFKRGNVGANIHYAENVDLASGFTDSSGNTLVVELDLPLNVPPKNDEKVFELFELQVAKEANVAGNSIGFEPIGEGASKGVQSISVYDGTSQGISRVAIPMRSAGTTGMTARDARLKITQTVGQRLDILGGSIQYLVHEEWGEGRVRK